MIKKGVKKGAKSKGKITPVRASNVAKATGCGNPAGKRPSLEIESGEFDESAFMRCVAQLRIAAQQHSPAQGIAAVSRFFQESSVRESLRMDSPLSSLQDNCRPIGQEGLDVREINMLERAGFSTVRSFCEAKPVDFAAIRYFGEATQERLFRIQASARKEIAGLSPKRSTRLEAIERALRGDLN